MSKRCATEWNFFFNIVTHILKVEASSSAFHGVFAREKWDVRVHNISDNTDFNIRERMVELSCRASSVYFHNRI